MSQSVAVQETEKRITRTLRVELAKPLGEDTWDSIGPQLRAMRSVMHRLLVASLLAAVESDRRSKRGEQVVSAADSKSGKPGILHPQTAAYRAVSDELEEIRKWAQDKCKRAKAGADQKHLQVLAVLDIPGGTKAAISATAFAAFQKWRKDKGSNRLPSWKHGAPIIVRAQESSLELDAAGRPVLDFKLRSEGHVQFAVRVGKGSQFGKLRELARANGTFKVGDLKIKYDERARKWFVFIAYSEPAPGPPPQCDPKHVMVLHRGHRNLLVAMTSRGHYSVIASGRRLLHLKRKLLARRLEAKQIRKCERGEAATGRGKTRRYALPEALSEKERNAIHTLCQQIAARAASLATNWGCGTVLIEEYDGIDPDEDRAIRRFVPRMPNHELKQAVAWALTKIGLPLGSYPHEYISQTCPRCGNQDTRNHNFRTNVFHCRLCSFDRDCDWVAPLHALRRACAGDAGEFDARLRREAELARELTKADEAE